MDNEKLEEFKRNSNNAFKYMEKVEKEYLTGKTLVDQKNFIHDFSERHTLEELDYLLNEMEGEKESRLLFTNGFFAITMPFYTILFAFLGIMTTAILGFMTSLSLKLVDKELEVKANNINLGIDMFSEVNSLIFSFAGGAILLILAIFLFMFWHRNNSDCKRIQHIAWLKYIKGNKR